MKFKLWLCILSGCVLATAVDLDGEDLEADAFDVHLENMEDPLSSIVSDMGLFENGRLESIAKIAKNIFDFDLDDSKSWVTDGFNHKDWVAAAKKNDLDNDGKFSLSEWNNFVNDWNDPGDL